MAFILLSESIAYAAIAHLSIQSALIGVLAGLLCYAWLGSSSFAIVAPTSSAAALLSAVVISLTPIDQSNVVQLAGALVIVTGAALLIFAKFGMGRLFAFVSRPVLQGFSFAVALTIIIKQIPLILGLQVHETKPFPILIELTGRFQEWHDASFLIGFAVLQLLWLVNKLTKLPGAFVALLLGIVLSCLVDLNSFHVALIGTITFEKPNLGFTQLPLEKWLQIVELAMGLLIIIVAESWGSIRGLALKHHITVIDANRELAALGLANLLSGLLQGMPVGAGFSASSINQKAGAKSKFSGIFAAFALLLMVIWGQAWISFIPQPVVAAVIIHTLSHALNPKSLIKLWHMDRDQYQALASVIAVLVFGLLHGMLISIGLSLVWAIRTFSRPIVKELAELGNSRDYVDKICHANAKTHENLLILRPEEPLFFANIEGVLSEIHNSLQLVENIKFVILSLEESTDLDSTAAQCLVEFALQLQTKNQILLLARVKDPIAQLMLAFANEQFVGKLFWSVDDAVCWAKSTREVAAIL